MKIQWFVGKCRVCGAVHPRNTAIMGAAGVYCPDHTHAVLAAASRHRDKQMATMLRERTIVLPLPLYDPVSV